jgi:hypothetical protein
MRLKTLAAIVSFRLIGLELWRTYGASAQRSERSADTCAYRKSHSAVFTNVTLLHCTQNSPEYQFAGTGRRTSATRDQTRSDRNLFSTRLVETVPWSRIYRTSRSADKNTGSAPKKGSCGPWQYAETPASMSSTFACRSAWTNSFARSGQQHR